MAGTRDRTLHYLALVVLAVLCLTPIYIMISTGFKQQVLILSGEPVWFFFTPTLDNYEYLMTRGKFDRYLTNSIIVGSVSTFLTLILGGFCAYAIARTEFHGRRTLASVSLLLRMVPPAVLAIPAFAIVITFGITND